VRLFLILALLSTPAFAADYEVLLAEDTANTEELPAKWPVKQQPLADGQNARQGWRKMTGAEVLALKTEHAAAKAAWDASRPESAEVTERKAIRALVVAAKAIMDKDPATWTAAELRTVVYALGRWVEREERGRN